MTTFIKIRTPKVSSQQLAESISFMRQLAKEKDLTNRTLNADEVRKIIHFVDAVSEKAYIKRLLPQDAITLLRATPALLEAKSSTTIHNIFHLALPMVKELNAQSENKEYQSILEDAGKVCFSRKLKPTTIDARSFEFKYFEDIVGETENYQKAITAFKRRNNIGLIYNFQILGEAAEAYHFQKGPLFHSGRGSMD